VCDTGAVLPHYECQSRLGEVTFKERELWYARRRKAIDAWDPFYNANLAREREEISLLKGAKLGL
jgi:hypothetical protein